MKSLPSAHNRHAQKRLASVAFLTVTTMLVQGLPFAALFSLAVYNYQRSLHPLYGSTPTQLYLTPVVVASLLLGTLAPAPSFPTNAYNAAIWLSILPRLARHAALWTIKSNDPIKGPLITHALVLAPLMLMSASIVKSLTVRALIDISLLFYSLLCRKIARLHIQPVPPISSLF